jgi:hypothetical protein
VVDNLWAVSADREPADLDRLEEGHENSDPAQGQSEPGSPDSGAQRCRAEDGADDGENGVQSDRPPGLSENPVEENVNAADPEQVRERESGEGGAGDGKPDPGWGERRLEQSTRPEVEVAAAGEVRSELADVAWCLRRRRPELTDELDGDPDLCVGVDRLIAVNGLPDLGPAQRRWRVGGRGSGGGRIGAFSSASSTRSKLLPSATWERRQLRWEVVRVNGLDCHWEHGSVDLQGVCPLRRAGIRLRILPRDRQDDDVGHPELDEYRCHQSYPTCSPFWSIQTSWPRAVSHSLSQATFCWSSWVYERKIFLLEGILPSLRPPLRLTKEQSRRGRDT